MKVSPLCRYFYGTLGPLGRSEIPILVKFFEKTAGSFPDPPPCLVNCVIYHHSGRYRPLYQKSNFWPKSRFLRFSRIFDFSRYGRPYGRKCSKMRSGDGNGLSESPKHLYIPWMTFNDDLNEF